jgi:1,2-dihydroxy-3-keto-5-methylthiopentene dioxygenase
MSRLQIYDETRPDSAQLTTHETGIIAATLREAGVRFERWPTRDDIATGTDGDAIVAAYRPQIDRLIADEGYQTFDVVSMHTEHPDKTAMRAKFLDEHTHSEDEVRFFVAGRGLFTLHIGARVFEVLCERGDLIGVPAHTRHWFDMGSRPAFVAIRFFNNPAGWVAQYTGTDIAARFPRLD